MKQFKNGIIARESGIVRKSGIFFHSISDFAERNLYHLFWGAEYECVSPYRVEDHSLNACLLFYINDGEISFTYRGKSFTATNHDVVLLDLNKKHSYFVDNHASFIWFLFQGPSAEEYCSYLFKQTGALFCARSDLQIHFLQIMDYLKENNYINEDRISILIQTILGELNNHSLGTQIVSAPIQTACRFIETHLTDNISVQLVADQVGLSLSHFSKLFYSEMQISPSRYLQDSRIKYAKSLLKLSSYSVEMIATECNYSSTSNFIRSFKQITGMTPAQYRNTSHEAV